MDSSGPWCMCLLCETCIDAGVNHNRRCLDVWLKRRWAARPASRYYTRRPSEGDCCQCDYCLSWFAEWRATGRRPRPEPTPEPVPFTPALDCGNPDCTGFDCDICECPF